MQHPPIERNQNNSNMITFFPLSFLGILDIFINDYFCFSIYYFIQLKFSKIINNLKDLLNNYIYIFIKYILTIKVFIY